MDKHVLNELLLVCSFVGTSRSDDASEGFVRGEDCVAWLQDLQRVLKSDESDERYALVKLGSWRVLQSKLLPIVEVSGGDAEATRVLLKIVVLLTLPLSLKAVDALRGSQDKENTEADPETLRGCAASQVRYIAEARAAIAARPRVLVAVLGMLQACVSTTSRSDSDQHDIELALTLVRNLVQPLPSAGRRFDDLATTSFDAIVVALDKELVLDVVAELAGAVRKRENEVLNLILVEILAALFTGHAAADIAAAEFDDKTPLADDDEQPKVVIDTLKRQKHTTTSTRHSRFCAKLRVKDSVAASALGTTKIISNATHAVAQAPPRVSSLLTRRRIESLHAGPYSSRTVTCVCRARHRRDACSRS